MPDWNLKWPTNDQMDQNQAALDEIEVEYFTATPSTTKPGEQSKLSWKVVAPHGGAIRLGNDLVNLKGSKVVSPVTTAVCTLTTRKGGVTIGLEPAVTVTVDASSSCMVHITEEGLDTLMTQGIESSISAYPRLRFGGVLVGIDIRVTRFVVF